ncbi:MAG TPA: DegT/DnrJ/EryC1/StrS family aminotransferase [Candidatus Sulfotelmatobacter sp.]|nr:DegT/DnrJ/EryC1/StrS family aminotransferase [Candidatus Sulfotelmatobacter sp.]
MGPVTIEFEQQFARHIGTRHAIAVSSCTAGLHLSLDAIGIEAGDEVIVPTTTFTATAEVVAYSGARPVLADIDPVSLNIDPAEIERRITPRTKATIPVHYGGQPCDMASILAISKPHSVHVIEDAAHSLPASYRGTCVGAIGEMTVFSFYATKTLTTGEGGMITTNNDEYASRMRLMRLHGIGRDAWKRYTAEGSWYYEVLEAGYKYNMTDIQAAMGLVQLGKLQQMASARSRIASRYNEAFGQMEQLEIPSVRQDSESAWHLYPLRIRNELLTISRDEFISALKEEGIGTSVHFIPLHLQPYYQKKYGYRAGDLPRAEAEYRRYISLPIFPTMQDREIEYVVEKVKQIVTANSRTTVFAGRATD